ncbi:MAG: ADP-ribosyl-[dinitrogen reductase] hydrolase [Chromatiaceae bacterium]|nr:ADP-ribosyl-[dinitrogen reductase] hydrolase [Chromatiaceae bacterium]
MSTNLRRLPGPRLGGDLERRALGAYLGLATGDALGATVELMTPREIRETYGEHRDIIGGGWLRLRPGQVTDDTQMSLALGRSILERGALQPRAVAEAFSDWMRQKPVDIGHTVRRAIVAFRETGSTERPPRDGDAGNGACMRCLPVALFTLGAPPAVVEAASCAQAHVTHHSPVADAGTLTVVRIVQSALLGGGRAELRVLTESLAARETRYRYDRRRTENPGAYLVETLGAVFQSLFATNTFEAALVDVVNRGGDADTTGAILGMIGGALYGADAIPERWLRRLEPAVARECIEQARGLVARSPLLGGSQGDHATSAQHAMDAAPGQGPRRSSHLAGGAGTGMGPPHPAWCGFTP